MPIAWADLPNAALIDEVLAAMRGAARDAAWTAAQSAVQGAALDAAWVAARGAVAALIAWDDAAQLYPLTPAQLRLTVALLPDNDHRQHAAVLLLPYAISREMCDD